MFYEEIIVLLKVLIKFVEQINVKFLFYYLAYNHTVPLSLICDHANPLVQT